MESGRLAPLERRALREIVERGDLTPVGEQVSLIGPVTAGTLDVLAAFETEFEDMEDDPDEAQGDDEPTIASAVWT